MQWRNRANRVLNRFGVQKLPPPRATYSESHFHFDPNFVALGRSVSLHGYFQSERYFADIADRLRDYFQRATHLARRRW